MSGERVLLTSEHNVVVDTRDPVLVGSVMVIPRLHHETPFELTPDEWVDTWALVRWMKGELDRRLRPDGYNLGWNCGAAAGQEVFHAHLHLIPRFNDEPLAGKGLRHHLKQPTNARPAASSPPASRGAE
jgi:diadenosine tetraphosphate (Ap4A) HIT family hydrolase